MIELILIIILVFDAEKGESKMNGVDKLGLRDELVLLAEIGMLLGIVGEGIVSKMLFEDVVDLDRDIDTSSYNLRSLYLFLP
mgnify:CR=1 FL=1